MKKASDILSLTFFPWSVSLLLVEFLSTPDLNASKSTPFPGYDGVEVHSGFFAAYNEVKTGMLNGLSQAIQSAQTNAIIITGHSLGGAMAELAALDLKLNYYPNMYIAVYTQGTPRQGNTAYSQLFTQTIDSAFRETHQADIVPHLPP